MKVILDEREIALYDSCYALLASQKTPSFIVLSKEVLPIGDILIQTDGGKDVLLVERKTFSDMLSSIKDGRYEEQSYRLLHSSGFPPHSIVYLLEGIMSQVFHPAEKKILYSAMTSLNFFKGFSVQRTASTKETAEWIFCMADKIEREFGKGTVPYYLTEPVGRMYRRPVLDGANDPTATQDPSITVGASLTVGNYCSVVKKVKKENVTPENIGEIVLCQIPGISSVTAITIMKKFTGFPHFLEQLQNNPGCLEGITIETNGKTRKINKSSVENIKKFFLKTNDTATIASDTPSKL
uniref:ERCC4 domain-containing protein n=1 Tax=viral metagenome TaxID=1070528 RepID=A0A6C0DNT8_9ZZZZ